MSIFRKKLGRNFKVASTVFTIVLMCGAAAYAQSINDDLKPKMPVVKTKTPVKTVKKTVSRRSNAPKSGTTRVYSSNNSPSSLSSAETSDQILNRFMNFQQSASVTDRDWKNVINQSAKILKDNPNHPTAKVQSLLAQGQMAYNARNYSMAIIHFKEALQIMPQSSVLHYSLGKTYLANGQAKAAESSLKESIDQNENFALAYKSLGDAFAAQGEKKTANKYFKKATEISVKSGNMAP